MSRRTCGGVREEDIRRNSAGAEFSPKRRWQCCISRRACCTLYSTARRTVHETLTAFPRHSVSIKQMVPSAKAMSTLPSGRPKSVYPRQKAVASGPLVQSLARHPHATKGSAVLVACMSACSGRNGTLFLASPA
jgi:hypothetical protein